MNKLIPIFLFSLLVFSCNKNDNPKPDESGLFVKFFGSAFDDNGFSVASADDGGYYLVGSTVKAGRPDTNILVVKIDAYGNKAWERSYTFNDNYNEVARDVIVDANGRVVVTGYKQDENSLDFLVLAIDKNNPDNIEKYIFGDSLADEKAYHLVQSGDGAFIVYGSSFDGVSSDMYLLKTHLTDTVWHRKVGVFSKDDDIGSFIINNNGQLVWCGTVERNDSRDMRLVLADDFGNLMWDYGFEDNDGIDQYGYGMDLLNDGGYIIAGSRNRTGSSGSVKDIYLVRTDNNGIQSNEMIIPGSASQEAYSVIAVDNQFAITGYTLSDKGDKNIYVAKLNENGAVLASKNFGGSGQDEGKKILKTNNGFIVIGTVEAGNNTMMAVYKLNDQLELVP